MILHIKCLKDFTKKLVELIIEFSKVAGYKIKIQKSLHLYMPITKTEIKQTIPFTVASKNT